MEIEEKKLNTLYLIIGGDERSEHTQDESHYWGNVFRDNNYLILDIVKKHNRLHIDNKNPTIIDWYNFIKKYFNVSKLNININIIIIFDHATLKFIECKTSDNTDKLHVLTPNLDLGISTAHLCFNDLANFIRNIYYINKIKGYGIPFRKIDSYKLEENTNKKLYDINLFLAKNKHIINEKEKHNISRYIKSAEKYIYNQRRLYNLSKNLFPKIRHEKYFKNTNGSKKNVDWVIFTR